MADATTDITNWICGKASSALPTTAPASIPAPPHHIPEESPQFDQDMIPLSDVEQPRKHEEGSELSRGIDGPAGVRRWIDRLTETLPPPSSSHFLLKGTWKFGVKARLTVGVGIMWIANIFWAH
jgi:hypothetical protein